MDIFAVLTLIGGLALFLFGMNVMGDSLVKVSGGKLDRILERLTSNRLKGVLLGLGVTAVIQSSSATTVMVVGFVNSGIMKLTQAVGVIMGANIGTTVTSWLLSLTGIEGSNFFCFHAQTVLFFPCSGSDWPDSDDDGEGQCCQEGCGTHPVRLCGADVWHGNHERRSRAAGSE